MKYMPKCMQFALTQEKLHIYKNMKKTKVSIKLQVKMKKIIIIKNK